MVKTLTITLRDWEVARLNELIRQLEDNDNGQVQTIGKEIKKILFLGNQEQV